jgi:hypothetical protein
VREHQFPGGFQVVVVTQLASELLLVFCVSMGKRLAAEM